MNIKNQFLQMYIEEIQQVYDEPSFKDYALLLSLIKLHFGDDSITLSDIKRYYEETTEEEDIELQIDNLKINY